MGDHVLAELAFQTTTHAHDTIPLGDAAATINSLLATIRASARTQLDHGLAPAERVHRAPWP